MTCIVGVVHDGRVWIGGDSAGSDQAMTAVRSDTKVFAAGPYLMGFTTSFRMGQLLRYALSVGAPDTWDVDRFMATTFIDAVRATLRDGGWMGTNDGRDVGGTFLVGVHGRLYEIADDFQIGCAAVGSGYLAALGSLHTSRALGDPRARVTAALEAAQYVTCYVRAPFTILDGP